MSDHTRPQTDASSKINPCALLTYKLFEPSGCAPQASTSSTSTAQAATRIQRPTTDQPLTSDQSLPHGPGQTRCRLYSLSANREPRQLRHGPGSPGGTTGGQMRAPQSGRPRELRRGLGGLGGRLSVQDALCEQEANSREQVARGHQQHRLLQAHALLQRRDACARTGVGLGYTDARQARGRAALRARVRARGCERGGRQAGPVALTEDALRGSGPRPTMQARRLRARRRGPGGRAPGRAGRAPSGPRPPMRLRTHRCTAEPVEPRSGGETSRIMMAAGARHISLSAKPCARARETLRRQRRLSGAAMAGCGRRMPAAFTRGVCSAQPHASTRGGTLAPTPTCAEPGAWPAARQSRAWGPCACGGAGRAPPGGRPATAGTPAPARWPPARAWRRSSRLPRDRLGSG
jgi:hypothetical protein